MSSAHSAWIRTSRSLRERVNMNSQQRFRLIGVGLSNFRESEEPPAQAALFD